MSRDSAGPHGHLPYAHVPSSRCGVPMRHAVRKDLNQADVVQELRKVGATVRILHEPLDLLVGFRGKNLLLEVKRPDKKGWRSERTRAQIKFMDTWRGQFAIVYTAQEAVDIVLHL